MPGPLPQWDARRRRGRPVDAARVLPADGRKGDPPPFPEPRRLTKDEQRRWAKLWATPQAEAWEQLELFDQVARLMRMQVAVDRALSDGSVRASMLSEIRQLEGALGLSPMALARLRWSIEDPVAEPKTRTRSTRERLRAVDRGESRPLPLGSDSAGDSAS